MVGLGGKPGDEVTMEAGAEIGARTGIGSGPETGSADTTGTGPETVTATATGTDLTEMELGTTATSAMESGGGVVRSKEVGVMTPAGAGNERPRTEVLSSPEMVSSPETGSGPETTTATATGADLTETEFGTTTTVSMRGGVGVMRSEGASSKRQKTK